MLLDEIVGMVIQSYYKEKQNKKSCMSRQKLPCTRCKALLSSTWRPGPCGTASLCNACGVQYMVRGPRPRMIDLVRSEGRVIWVERTDSGKWDESHPADMNDLRIRKWAQHEEERVDFVESKKRKFVEL